MIESTVKVNDLDLLGSLDDVVDSARQLNVRCTIFSEGPNHYPSASLSGPEDNVRKLLDEWGYGPDNGFEWTNVNNELQLEE